jgi:hypothetical protein
LEIVDGKRVVLQGHGFSRAELATKEVAALAAEGCFDVRFGSLFRGLFRH